MEKKFGKRELVLLIVLFAVILVLWLAFRFIRHEDGNVIRVTVGTETFGEYDLSVDQEIPIEAGGEVTNVLVIADGKADMVSADCPDQTCVNMAPVYQENDTIVCLPNQVVVEVISSDEASDFDVIAQ